jgi:hypothetical protein
VNSFSWSRAFWLKPISIFGLFPFTTFISGSHVLTIPFPLAPDRRDAGSPHRLSQVDEHRKGEATLSSELPHPPIAQKACLSRGFMAEHEVVSRLP